MRIKNGQSKKIAIIDDQLYVYRKHEDSETTNKGSDAIIHITTVLIKLAEFYASNKMSKNVKCFWARNIFNLMFWDFFNSRFQTAEDKKIRATQFKRLLKGIGFKTYLSLSIHSKLPKFIALFPIWFYYYSGIEWPATLYFKKIYYPVAMGRGKETNG